MLRQMDGILFFRGLGYAEEAVVFLPVCRDVRPLHQKKQMYFAIAWHMLEEEQTSKTKTTSVLEPEMSKCLLHCPPAFSLLESCSLPQTRRQTQQKHSDTNLGLVKQSESLKPATVNVKTSRKTLQCTWYSQFDHYSGWSGSKCWWTGKI